MAIFKCKMCGGDIELSADKTFGTCEYCGSSMTFPKADDEQRAAAFNRGNHFRRIGEFDKALAVYERIVREDNTDAEAHWCCALCRFGIEYVEDPATYEYLPTCHRASFDSFLEDVDYLAAVEYSDGLTKRQYQKDAAKIAEVQRGILATSQNEEPFDVFICYKESDENGERTRDSLMAQDVYYQLTDQGYRVFFSRITLEDMVGKQYEPYIFAALNSAKVMIVIGTKPEYMNAIWVKNEWSRFLAMMKKDHSKLLLPCYRDMDPYDMPEQLSVLQSYDMAKIGFIQDLIRGIKKVLDADKKPEPTKETVVVQQTANINIAPLLKRGYISLEDSEWDKADQLFEDVLNMDPECAEAYLGKMLVDARKASMDVYIEDCLSANKGEKERVFYTYESKSDFKVELYIDQMCQKYKVPSFLTEQQIQNCCTSDAGYYESQLPALKRKLAEQTETWNKNRTLQRAMRYDTAGTIKAQFEQLLSTLQQQLDETRRAEQPEKERAEKAFEQFMVDTELMLQERHDTALKQRETQFRAANNKKIPLPVVIKDDVLICPSCQLSQQSRRRVCWRCNQVFINGQIDIPYWCGNCGNPGPFDDGCTVCGSADKIVNTTIQQ